MRSSIPNRHNDPLKPELKWLFRLSVIAVGIFFLARCDKADPIELANSPNVISTTPERNASDVAANIPITARFSEKMDPSSITDNTFLLKENSSPDTVSGVISYADSIATLTPASDLEPGKTYTATITADVKNLSGNTIERDYGWNFTISKEPTQSDISPPQVIAMSPANEAQDVAIDAGITASFNEPLNPSTVNKSSFTVKQGTNTVSGAVSYDNNTASFTPSAALAFGTSYTVTITTSIQDTAGNSPEDNFSWSFVTGNAPDNTPPAIVSTQPEDMQKEVTPNTNITVTFSEAMDPASINNSTFTLRQGSTGISGTVSYSGNTSTFKPSGDLAFDATYTATVNAGIQDLAGNKLSKNYSWSFTTGKEPDNTAPQIISVDPAVNKTDVPVNTNITAEFSEPMNSATINSTTFKISQGGNAVSGNVTYSGVTAIFNPNSNLDYGKSFTVTITSGAEDVAGNTLTQNRVWTFTTVQETIPPTVTGTNPVDKAANVSVFTDITATFSEPMNPATINGTTFTLSQNGNPVSGTISYSGNTATFTPNSNLTYGNTFAAVISTGVEDEAGNNLQNNVTWSFTTENAPDNTAPQIVSTDPPNNDSDVPANTNITVTFNEAINSSTINSSTFKVNQGGSPVGGVISLSASGITATFDPYIDLASNKTFTVTITTAVQDLAGNPLAQNQSWSFTTAQETTPPTVISTNPANNAGNIAVNINITATFSEAMDPATINNTTFTVRQNGNPISGTVSYSGTTAIFNPNSNLNYGSTITATITTGAQDLAGNSLANNFSWEFTTVQETIPPTVISTSPTDGATDIPVGTAITATFSEPMNPATINGTTFTLSQNGNPVSGTVTYSGNTTTFTPNANLSYGNNFTAVLSTGVEDEAGNNLQNNFSWNFTSEEAPDNTPPQIVSTNPVNDATDVPITTNITVTFSEAVNPSTITSTTFKVSQGKKAVDGAVAVSADGSTATFNPYLDLENDKKFTVTLSTGVQDLAGNNLASNYSWSFTTARETTPPTIESTIPADNAADVAINTSITATFSESMNSSTINGTTFTVTQGGTPVSGTVSHSGTTAIFNPDSNLDYNTTITATITTGAQDLAGNSLASNYSWSFTTVQETIPPTVTSTSPNNGAKDVSAGTLVTATFSEPMDPATINGTTFTLSQNGGGSIAGTVNYTGNTTTFTPDNALPFSTTFTATITTGVKDEAGNNLQNSVSWSFTTEQETIPPTVDATTPAVNATDVPINTDITATFSEAMDQNTINGTTFTVSQNGTAVSGTVSYSGTTATFNPSSDLPFNTQITATITTGARDLVGNSLASNYSWTFTTVQETTPPTVESTSPTNGATAVPAGINVTATFSEAMNTDTINGTTFIVSQGGSPLNGTVDYSYSNQTAKATFTPSTNLPFNTQITATITTGAEDLAGNSLTADYSWSFTVETISKTGTTLDSRSQ